MQELRELFYDPREGFVNKNTLIKKAKNKGIKLTTNEISNFYDAQEVNQIYKSKTTKNFKKITCKFGAVGCLQMDLMDFNRFSTRNKNFKWLQMVI